MGYFYYRQNQGHMIMNMSAQLLRILNNIPSAHACISLVVMMRAPPVVKMESVSK
jgi:hypothetical protein